MSSSTKPISIHDEARLGDEIKKLKPHAAFHWMVGFGDKTIQDAEVDVHGLKLKTSFLSTAYRNMSLGKRYDLALWSWLEPEPPTLKAKQLKGLQSKVGLEHLPYKQFLADLRERCLNLSRRNKPELRFWIDKRVALLDYELEGLSEAPEELNYILADLQSSS